jgi:hypothetical protein
MFRKSLTVLAMILSGAPVAHASDWTTADTMREAAVLAVSFLDWKQTRFVSDPSQPNFCEGSPFMGRSPSAETVNLYFLVSCAAHVLIASQLKPETRRTFQYVSIAYEFSYVAYNYHIGVKITF